MRPLARVALVALVVLACAHGAESPGGAAAAFGAAVARGDAKAAYALTSAAYQKRMPYEAFAAGLGDHRIVTTLCPGGRERMRRLMELVRQKRVDLSPMLTHRFTLENIAAAYELFGSRADGVLKVAIRP